MARDMLFNATFNNISVYNVFCGGQFYWLSKPEYPEKTTNLAQVTIKLYHNVVSSTTHNERDFNSQL